MGSRPADQAVRGGLTHQIEVRLYAFVLQRNVRAAAIRLLGIVALGSIGFTIGWFALGTWFVGMHDRVVVRWCHIALAPFLGAMLPASGYATVIVRAWLRKEGVNPTFVTLFAFSKYTTLVGAVLVGWAVWVIPIRATWQLMLVAVAPWRPAMRRRLELLNVPRVEAPFTAARSLPLMARRIITDASQVRPISSNDEIYESE